MRTLRGSVSLRGVASVLDSDRLDSSCKGNMNDEAGKILLLCCYRVLYENAITPQRVKQKKSDHKICLGDAVSFYLTQKNSRNLNYNI